MKKLKCLQYENDLKKREKKYWQEKLFNFGTNYLNTNVAFIHIKKLWRLFLLCSSISQQFYYLKLRYIFLSDECLSKIFKFKNELK